MSGVKVTASPIDGLTAYAVGQVPDAIIITDADLGRLGAPSIIYVNDSTLRVTGYDRDELIGQSPKMLQGEGTDRVVASRIMAQLRAGKLVREVILNYRKDGTPYWVELKISPMRDAQGTIIAYLSIQHDLTDFREVQKQYERDIRLISSGEKIARVGAWSYNLVEEKVLWSDGAYEIFERVKGEGPPTITEALGRIDEIDRPLMANMLHACIKDQIPYQAEVRAHSSNGKAILLNMLGEAMLGENGRTVAVVGAIRDITQEKRLEAELYESISENRETAKFFLIARSVAKIGVFDYWVDHDRLHWSDELFDMTGLLRSLFPASAVVFLSQIDPEHRAEYERLMQASFESREGFSLTVPFIRLDGRTMHMAIIADIQDSDYGPRVVGIVRDVTNEVESAQLLRREQERFHIIAGTVIDVLWDHDLEKKNFWITPNWPSKLGVDFDNLSDDPVGWLVHVMPEERDAVVVSITQALHAGADRWERNFTIFDEHGTQVEVEVKASILRKPDGVAHRLLGNCRNVTVEKRQREGFTRSRALEAVGQMTGGIAHDFNNLLMIIQGNAELLEMGELDSEDAESVRLIMQATESAANLTARLLSFSGQSKLHNARIDVRKLIDDAAILIRSGLTNRISITTNIASDLRHIEVDGRALEQAIINLAVNAGDAIGLANGSVEISCENVVVSTDMIGGGPDLNAGHYVCVSVSDDGAGMTDQVKSKAFEPFLTTKEVGKGTGLGLSAVYGFARQCGGHVQIYSELGHGTTVKVYVPVSETEQLAVYTADTAPVSLDYAGLRVLVVEDQHEVLSNVERVLTNSGFDVTTASDGNLALCLLEDGLLFDLLFTDVIMPGGMNGVQLAEAAACISPQMKVLFTSGFPASAFDEIGMKRENEYFLLKKPYKQTELISAICKALNGVV